MTQLPKRQINLSHTAALYGGLLVDLTESLALVGPALTVPANESVGREIDIAARGLVRHELQRIKRRVAR
jgi:hypothetical protein